ncbi:hypothetical protein XELAEV_18029851mg [Xenopus laevis]|uniref:GIY-YIG domain-containing protein n=1 Tax=Xenopus laevis TaxID=8355 RepID=A0A974CUK4_XENLA|nr:hypothetical protein XELAEV_18029851mg [Xenopus laevis]
MFSFKRARSLHQLVKTDLIENEKRQPTFFGTPQKGAYPCISCHFCDVIIKGNKFNHPSKGYDIKLKDFATCHTRGVIYMLKCPCGKVYVGKTKRQRSIDNCDLEKMKYVTPISRHFKTHGHKSKKFRWLVLQVVKFPRRGEVLWIEKLNTLAPMGLNKEVSYSCFY